MLPTRQTILAVGPPTHMIGGMAQVADQVLRLDGRAGCRVVRFDTTFSKDARETLPARTLRHLRHIRRLRHAVRRSQPAIVHIHTCSGFSFHRSVADMLTAQRAGCPVVLHFHGASFDEFFEKSGPVTRCAIRWSLTRADRIIALSRSWKLKLAAMAPRSRISIIENAVEIPETASCPSEAPPCRFVLLARMDVWKGIDDLLTACTCLRDENLPFRVTMAGPPGSAGDERTLTEKIRDLGLNDLVRYIGPVQGDAKSDLLRRSHAYVQPSHNEGMPIAVLEAMAQGLPIVATRVGGVPEMLTDGCEGILAPAGQPVRLAAAMRTVIVDPTVRASMARAARALAVKRFALERFHADLLALYEDISGARKRPRPSTAATDATSVLHPVRSHA